MPRALQYLRGQRIFQRFVRAFRVQISLLAGILEYGRFTQLLGNVALTHVRHLIKSKSTAAGKLAAGWVLAADLGISLSMVGSPIERHQGLSVW
jgi:hypothetical protein